MANVIRAALVQTDWTGDKESMIEGTRSTPARRPPRARRSSASRSCSTGPTSARCRTPQYYEYAESIPRPDQRALPGAGHGARHGDGAADVRAGAARACYYNTAAVVDADGTYLGKYRKHHIPQVEGLLGEVLLPARQPRLPGVRHRGRQGRRVHLLRPALPRGLAGARPERRADRVQPVGDQPRAVGLPLELEQPAAAVANEYFVGAINRVGIEAARRRRLLRHARTSSTPRASSSATSATPTSRADRARPRHGPDRRACATAGRSTGTAAPTPTASWSTVSEQVAMTANAHHRRHGRPATGAHAADVLVDGETIAAVLAPGPAARGRHRRPDRSTPPASTSCPAASTCTRTWSCPSAAPFASDTFETGTPGRGLGRHHDHRRLRRCRRTGGSVQDGAAAPGTQKADGNCAIDYGFHQIIGGVDEDALKAMDYLVDHEGITSFKLFMAYPGVFYCDDGQILRAMQTASEQRRRDHDARRERHRHRRAGRAGARPRARPTRSTTASSAARSWRARPPTGPSCWPTWPATCRCTSCTCRPARPLEAVAAARARRAPTCSPRRARSTST